VAELVVVTDGYLQSSGLRILNDPDGIRATDCERLFDDDVAAMFEALQGNFHVTLRRRRNMDNIRAGSFQHAPEITEARICGKPVAELSRHQFLGIACSYEPASGNPLKRQRVSISDLAAADDRSLNHNVFCSSPYDASALLLWGCAVSIPAAASASRCCNACSSTSRARDPG
jgi:hypothetical protein